MEKGKLGPSLGLPWAQQAAAGLGGAWQAQGCHPRELTQPAAWGCEQKITEF